MQPPPVPSPLHGFHDLPSQGKMSTQRAAKLHIKQLNPLSNHAATPVPSPLDRFHDLPQQLRAVLTGHGGFHHLRAVLLRVQAHQNLIPRPRRPLLRHLICLPLQLSHVLDDLAQEGGLVRLEREARTGVRRGEVALQGLLRALEWTVRKWGGGSGRGDVSALYG
jgi:hypothetical protein